MFVWFFAFLSDYFIVAKYRTELYQAKNLNAFLFQARVALRRKAGRKEGSYL